MWMRPEGYVQQHASGKVRISKWPLAIGDRYVIQVRQGDQWVASMPPAALSADEARSRAEAALGL